MTPKRARIRALFGNLRRTRSAWPDSAALIVLILLFALTRGWAAGRGVAFDGSLLPLAYQFLDPVQLRDNAREALVHLHAQPPLFNAFLAVMLDLFANDTTFTFNEPRLITAFDRVFAAVSLMTILVTYGVARVFGLNPVLSGVAAGLLALSPSLLLYENWLFYTLFEAAGMAALVLGFAWYVRRAGFAAAALLFVAMAGLCLLRSLFHPLWALAVVGLAVAARPKDWRTALLAAAIPMLVVFGVASKNQILFGKFGTSTWLGMSLSKMATDFQAEEDLARIVEEEDLPPILTVMEFEPVSSYEPYIDMPEPRGVAVLDKREKATGAANMNHLAMITVSDEYMSGALRMIAARPGVYAGNVARAALLFFRPAGEYLFTVQNTHRIRREVQVLNALLFGRFGQHSFISPEGEIAVPPPAEREIELRQIGFWIPIVFLATLLIAAARLAHCAKRREMPNAETMILVFSAFQILWVTFFGVTLDVGENMRFRFVLEPLYFVLLVWLISAAVRRFRPQSV